ncbi:MAG: Uma2 family endonuclease [Leptolyngbyaceae cyanobacterium RU_5_1]|nr:Uma2 family endonuclease [Leptolyngbyaceae cyanobacterium RU_5_1]
MTVTTKRFTFEEYLAYDDGTDTRYELVDGELIAMAVSSGLHGEIMHFLEQGFEAEIQRPALGWIARKAVISLRSPRSGRWDTARIPDVVVIPPEQWKALRVREAVIELNDPAPLLVVEVVSESTKTVDYRAKRVEYNGRDIPEYWIVDPLDQKVTVCTLVEGLYDVAEFTGADPIHSPTFSELALTAHQVLTAGE